MVKILAIDDDRHLLETLVEQISLEPDYDVVGADCLAEAREKLAEIDPDLILLDVSLPDGDGRDMCRWIRAQGFTIPILMLTAQHGEMDTIDGLEAGANDYIAKPLRLGELLARIKTHLSQYQLRADARISIGAFYFNPGNKTLTHQETGKMLGLTEKETAIIRFMYQHKDDVIEKQNLLEQVWGYSAQMTTHTLETHIYRLRQKIRDLDEEPFLVTNKKGYQLKIS
ncbi:MAG: response regulator transcription factor [Candidatus Puniceispirillales bacterium]